MKIEKVKALYNEAQTMKSFIISKYNQIATHTMPFVSVYDKNTGQVSKKINQIDPVIIQASNWLNNFIMSTMLANGQFASVKLDRELFDQMVIDIEDIRSDQYKELTTQLEDDTRKVFKFLQNSNFHSTVAKTLSDVINLGTACFKIQEQDSITEPFSMTYINIAELFVTEDAHGKPSNVFRRYANVSKDDLKELFKLENVEHLKDDNNTLIESVVKDTKDGIDIFTHRLTNENFDEIFHEEELTYSPFIVYRWNSKLDNPYGLGIGFECLDEFERLKHYKHLQRSSAEINIFPPLAFTGQVEYMNKINYGMGKVSFLGASADISTVNPLNTGSNYLALSDEIMKSETLIRDSYMSTPIGAYTDRGVTTAKEIEERMNMFKERFGGVFELLTDELLKATFINIFKLLIKRGKLSFPYDKIKLIELRYTNKATKSADQEKAQEIIQFKQVAASLFPEESKFAISSLSMLPELARLMDIPEDMFYDKKQVAERVDQFLQQQVSQGPQEGGNQDEAQGNTGTQETVR